MSARSIARAHSRQLERSRRRLGTRAVAGIAGAAAVAAIGAGPAGAATLQVTNNNDTGPGSFRDQVTAANAAPDADTITFASNVTGSIVLGSTVDVTAPLTVQGPGADQLAIDGDDSSQVLFVEPAATPTGARMPFSLSGLTITGGYTSGPGAGIYGDYVDVSISDAVITGNEADDGGGLYFDSARVSIADTEVSHNRASGGGGIYIDGDNDGLPGDTFQITDSVVSRNRASGSGGGVYIDNATGSDATFLRTTVAGNTSGSEGGGILFYGHHGKSVIRESTISGNTASYGGGVYFDSETSYTGDRSLIVENSTFADNHAETSGGGIYLENDADQPVRIGNSTIAGNVSDGTGGGIARLDFPATLTSSIVANNSAVTAGNDLSQALAATGTFVVGNSLVEDPGSATITQDPAGSNVIGTDPALGPLADNGGPTRTLLPAAGSPVLDKGIANGLSTDQRGLPRTSGGGTDIGSVEVQVTPPDVTVDGAKVSAKKTQKQKGKKVVLKVKAGADEKVDLVASGQVKVGKKKYALKKVTKKGVAGGKQLTLKLKPKQKKASEKILADVKKAKATVKVKFTDETGNTAKKSVKIKLG